MKPYFNYPPEQYRDDLRREIAELNALIEQARNSDFSIDKALLNRATRSRDRAQKELEYIEQLLARKGA